MLKNGAVNFATTEAMAANLSNWAGLETPPTSIPNTFPWADSPKKDINADKRDPNCVSFYWFSQTIGPGRGFHGPRELPREMGPTVTAAALQRRTRAEASPEGRS